MTEGLDRRAEPTDRLRGSVSVAPLQVHAPSSGGGVSLPRVPTVNSFTTQVAERLGKYAGDELTRMTNEARERSILDGQLASIQGDTMESVEMEGDKWKLHGYSAMNADTMLTQMGRALEHEITSGAYEKNPEDYKDTLRSRIEGMLKDVPVGPIRDQMKAALVAQSRSLLDAQMKKNLQFTETQAFESLANTVDTISRDNSRTGALIAYANGTHPATQGLSIERRRQAMTQGVVNAFRNGNPAAYAHLEAGGLLTTEHLTASQIGAIESAKNAYHARIEKEVNTDYMREKDELDARVKSGELDPVAAAEEFAALNGKHNRRTSHAQASTYFDAAKAGVEFNEGTRGINIKAAGQSGNYKLQAKLMQDAVIHQESRGNPNARSPVGAVGIMQLMPGTMAEPGFGVRNIFQVASDLGVPFDRDPAKASAEADRLALNEKVNATMGTEYLEAMLKRYGGNVEKALVAYNWGAGNADNWDGDYSKLPEETRNYVKKITASFNDNRPDPEGERAAAIAELEGYEKDLALSKLRAIAPQRAINDEALAKGAITYEDWFQENDRLHTEYGIEVDAQRVNQEAGLLRNAAGVEIGKLQAEDQSAIQALLTQNALAFESVRDQVAAGELPSSALLEASQTRLAADKEAYQQFNVTPPAGERRGTIDRTIREAHGAIRTAEAARRDRMQIMTAERAGTVGTLPKDLQAKGVATMREQIAKEAADLKAAKPDVPDAQLSAMAREKEISYLATNGVVDEQTKQQINLAASGAWIDKEGRPNPSVVVGLQMFMGMLAKNPALAYQYVPDPKAQGRMIAATQFVQTMMPDLDVFASHDLSNPQDPVANAFYRAVEQIGLGIGRDVDPEAEAARVADAQRRVERGRLEEGLFGVESLSISNLTSTSLADQLIPSDPISAGLTAKRDMKDVWNAKQIDADAVNSDLKREVTKFLQQVGPHMPESSQEGMVKAAMDFVTARGAILGDSFVMPSPNGKSVRAQMFPGQQVVNPMAPHTAIVDWMKNPEAISKYPALKHFNESRWFFQTETPPYSVHVTSQGQYFATIPGSGSVALPLEEIGQMYIKER